MGFFTTPPIIFLGKGNNMFNTPYETTACKAYITKNIENAIKNSVGFRDGFIDVYRNNERRDGAIVAIVNSSYTKDIPNFNHPFVMGEEDKQVIYIDARSYSNPKQTTFEKIDFKNATENYFNLTKAKLMHIWLDKDPNILKNISTLPASAFTAFFTERIGRNYALNPTQQIYLSVHTALYYYNLFFTIEDLRKNISNDHGIAAMITHVNKTVKVPIKIIEEVIEIYKDNDLVSDLDSYCNLCEKVTNAVALRDIAKTNLYSLLGGGWIGNREVVAVAIEYPPIWIAMISLALNERTYKNSTIAQIVERSIYRTPAELYQKQLKGLMNYYDASEKDSYIW